MNMTNSIIEFRRYLKRRNYSVHTIKNYLHSIKQFVVWVDMVTIQDLLGHSRIATTERYSKVSNVKVQRDYHKAMEFITDESLAKQQAGNYKKFFTEEKRRLVSNNIIEDNAME